MRLALVLTLLLALPLTVLALSAACEEAEKTPESDSAVIFITGHELGALQPCGCSGGQLGGLDRRKAVLDSVKAERRLVLDVGRLVEGDDEQETIKFNILMEAFNLLGYDAVNFTEEDIKIAEELGIGEGITSFLNVISPAAPEEWQMPKTFVKSLKLGDGDIAVKVATADLQTIKDEAVGAIFGDAGADELKVLILPQCELEQISDLADKGIADVFICPPEMDEPVLVNKKDNWPMIVSAGKLGKYVVRIDITREGAAGDFELKFSPVKVEEDLARSEELIELYRNYQLMVKDANLLGKMPRFSLPEGIEFAGNKACSYCHQYEYDKWSTKKHAHAYGTLEEVGSNYDPECVICHVVGLEYESGFVSPEKTPELKEVGCEVCHGPGSKHASTGGTVPLSDPKMMCLDCHTPENSANYAGNEEEYFKKIIHWREPASPENVKQGEDVNDNDD